MSHTTIGPFRILRRLGSGGMAETFEGVREGPGGFAQRVCVKRVLGGMERDPEVQRLFLREARLAAALSHRAITRVIDFGRTGDELWLALELIEGMDLRQLLKRQDAPRRLPEPLACFVALELAEALAHAHARGPVVHRDVAPANVLVGRDGAVKLTDFGIAKDISEPGPATLVTRGNMRYMAPEVLTGERVDDPRSDLFSLGVVLFQCLAGQRPYEAHPGNLPAAIAALVSGQLLSLKEVVPGLDPSVYEIVDALLEPRPCDRFQRAAAVARALGGLVDGVSERRSLAERVARADTRDRTPAVGAPAVGAPMLVPARPSPYEDYRQGPGEWPSLGVARALREIEGRPLPEELPSRETELLPEGELHGPDRS